MGRRDVVRRLFVCRIARACLLRLTIGRNCISSRALTTTRRLLLGAGSRLLPAFERLRSCCRFSFGSLLLRLALQSLSTTLLPPSMLRGCIDAVAVELLILLPGLDCDSVEDVCDLRASVDTKTEVSRNESWSAP